MRGNETGWYERGDNGWHGGALRFEVGTRAKGATLSGDDDNPL